MSEYKIIRYRIFGSHDCSECVKMQKAMTLNAFDFDFIDCDDPKNEYFADQHLIDEMPHIQAFYEETNEVIAEYKGYISPKKFKSLLDEVIKSKNNSVQRKATNRKIPIDPNPKKGCSGCSKKKKNK